MFKKIVGLFLITWLCFNLGASFALAAEFIGPDNQSGNVDLSLGDDFRNIYTVGNVVNLKTEVEKDAFVLGNILTITGKIGDDLTALGSTILVQGDVGGSLRLAGANIIISGQVEEDVLVAGANVIIADSAQIKGDLVVASGNLDIRGSVAGDVNIRGGVVLINSRIEGQVLAKIKESLTLGSSAELVGDLSYQAEEELELVSGAKILGQVDYTKSVVNKRSLIFPPGFWAISFLISLLGLILVGLILVYFFNKITEEISKKAVLKFWPCLGLGLSVFFITPIICLLLLVTGLGALLSFILFVIYLFSLALAGVIAAIIFGSWLIKLIKKESGYQVTWLIVVVGAIGLRLIGLIPFLGWFVYFIFFLIGLGSFWLVVYQKTKSLR